MIRIRADVERARSRLHLELEDDPDEVVTVEDVSTAAVFGADLELFERTEGAGGATLERAVRLQRELDVGGDIANVVLPVVVLRALDFFPGSADVRSVRTSVVDDGRTGFYSGVVRVVSVDLDVSVHGASWLRVRWFGIGRDRRIGGLRIRRVGRYRRVGRCEVRRRERAADPC